MYKALNKLLYLEQLIDFEGGHDRGPLSGKDVLVYAPDKTGTVTLFHALGGYFAQVNGWSSYEQKVLHNHSNRGLLATTRAIDSGIKNFFLNQRSIVKDLIEYKRLTGQTILIVSSFREPISRGISYVFQGLDKQTCVNLSDGPETFDFEKHFGRLRRFLSARGFEHSLEEIEPDFFDKEQFDKSRKFLLVDRGHYRILVLCLEHSDQWQEILETELGFAGLRVIAKNKASDKEIAGMYKDFKSRLSLPESTIRDIYYNGPNVKYLKWFYTDDEIVEFYKGSLSLYGLKTK